MRSSWHTSAAAAQDMVVLVCLCGLLACPVCLVTCDICEQAGCAAPTELFLFILSGVTSVPSYTVVGPN
jgi:hypothetical protein